MRLQYTRRELFQAAAAASAPVLARANAPSAPVAVARCRTYEPAELYPVLERMFDQIGGLGRLVKDKTVAIKLNLTGTADRRLGHAPLEQTTWTHPAVVLATMRLMDRAGVRRIRLLESPWSTAEPLEEFMLKAGWEPEDFVRAARRVEFREHELSGLRQAVLPLPGAARRPSVSRLRSQPLLSRL